MTSSYPHLSVLLAILRIVEGEQHVTIARLCEVTGLSDRTVKREISAARRYGIDIRWTKGRGYRVNSYGVLNRDFFKT